MNDPDERDNAPDRMPAPMIDPYRDAEWWRPPPVDPDTDDQTPHHRYVW